MLISIIAAAIVFCFMILFCICCCKCKGVDEEPEEVEIPARGGDDEKGADKELLEEQKKKIMDHLDSVLIKDKFDVSKRKTEHQ
jgi:hypothetical protein